MNSADDVGISIEKLQKLLQTEQTATAATEHASSDSSCFVLHFRFEVLQNGSNEFQQCNEQRPACDRTEMKDQSTPDGRQQGRTWTARSIVIPIVSGVDTG